MLINQYIDHGFNVNLPHVYEKLTLGDYSFSKMNLFSKSYIINLSNKNLIDINNIRYNIINISIDDSYNVKYDYFKRIMLYCCNIINKYEKCNLPLIINCYSGINRACSLIIAYSFLYKDNSIYDTIKYIQSVKKDKYIVEWPTLTNKIFLRYLLKMKKEMNTQIID